MHAMNADKNGAKVYVSRVRQWRLTSL